MALQLLNSKFRHLLSKESNKWNPDGPWRLPSLAYTLEHKLAFLEREHYLFGSYSVAGLLHDADKLFLYLTPFLSEKKIQQIHCSCQPHHINSAQKSVQNLMNMYVDWDCAAITKPDKPLDAYATLLHFYQSQILLMLPICLAIAPARVSPLVMDLDEKRKKGYSSYLFQSDEYNQALYQKTRFCLACIAHKKGGNRIKLVHKNIHEMEPHELFYLCLNIMAQRRKQKIDWEKVQLILQRKLEFFQQFEQFKIELFPKPLTHDYALLSVNPFLQ